MSIFLPRLLISALAAWLVTSSAVAIFVIATTETGPCMTLPSAARSSRPVAQWVESVMDQLVVGAGPVGQLILPLGLIITPLLALPAGKPLLHRTAWAWLIGAAAGIPCGYLWLQLMVLMGLISRGGGIRRSVIYYGTSVLAGAIYAFCCSHLMSRAPHRPNEQWTSRTSDGGEPS